MNIIKDYISNGAKGNALPITQPDVAVVRSSITNPENQCIRVHDGSKRIYLIDVFMENGNPDNCTVHRGGPRSEDIEHVMIIDCRSGKTRKEQSFDFTVGKYLWLINSSGISMNIGHEVSYVFLINVDLDELKIKASDHVYIINSRIGSIKFEKQGDAGSGVGKEQGPRKVFCYNTTLGSKSFGKYESAYKPISKLPDWLKLPEVPAELVEFLKTPYVIENAVYGLEETVEEEPADEPVIITPPVDEPPVVIDPVGEAPDDVAPTTFYVNPDAPVVDDLKTAIEFLRAIVAKI